MAVSLLIVATTILLGFAISRQMLGAQSVWEGLSLAPLVACFVVIGGANAWGPVQGRWPLIIAAGSLGLILLFLPTSAEPGDSPGPGGCEGAEAAVSLSTRWKVGLGVLLALLVGYVAFAQAFTLDTDNWIHEPLIAGYTLGIFPPVHPFFPEVEMHGHYGRDLLVGTLLPQGADPLLVVWWLNPLLALCSAGVLLAIFRRWGDSPSGLLAAVAMPFFGVCVGVRVGLVDSFDGNNGVVYALAIALFYAMLRVFEMLPSRRPGHPLGLYLSAGYMLGVYQLVYETHFGLFLLTGAMLLVPALWRSQRKGRLLGGIALTVALALGLACTEGGPLTDLFRSHSSPTSVAQTNVGQHVSMTFPKKALFCVQATSAEYQRLSPGFRLSAFRGMAPSIAEEGYLNIFSPGFLVTHWLPLFLAPLTLVWLVRRRHWPGLAFWAFGLWAYLVPALVDFGPVYEWEYFRWEFAAGFAFSVPLGLFCGSLLDSPGVGSVCRNADKGGLDMTLGPRAGWALLGGALLLLALWPAEKMVNRAVIDVQKYGWPYQSPPGSWRVARPELGVTEADIACAKLLSQQILPAEVALTNLGSETPLGLWPDCVLSALSGARIAGRAKPPEGSRVHAHPNYHRSALQKALLASERPDLLWNAGVSWLLLDPSTSKLDEALGRSPHALLELRAKNADGSARELWKLTPPPSLSVSQVPSQPPFRSQTLLKTEAGFRGLGQLDGLEWRSGHPYCLRIAAFNGQKETARLGWLRIDVRDAAGRAASEPISYLLGANPLPAGTGDLHDVVFVTPREEGSYTVTGRLLGAAGEDALPLFSFPLNLSLLNRLSSLKAQMEVPGEVATRSFLPLKLSLSSAEALTSRGELQLLSRIRQVDGDYVWELDRLPAEFELNLSKAGTQVVEWNITAPWREGAYDLELEILDKATGARVPLELPSARIVVVKE